MGKIRTAGKRRLDPQDVLAGRVRPTVFELLELVRDVNPTGADLPAAAAQARYALKDRLQDLLIRRFPGELSLAPEPEQPELLRLEHRGGQSGCHLRLTDLDALDGEARAWAQRELDLGPGHAWPDSDPAPAGVAVHAPPRHVAGGLDGDDPLHRGLRLLREYDYEGARACLEEALRGSGGAPRPARALLGLLVDELGLDEDALGLQGELSAEAAADPEVRARLGLAAARAGRPDEARALLAGLRRPACAAAWLLLAAQAEAGGDLDGAEAELGAARESDPAHPELAPLQERLDRRRKEARRPDEEAAEALLAQGALEQAAERARIVLRRFPGSEAARRVLRAADGQKREGRAAALLEQAERAAGEGERGRAFTLLSEAAATGVGGALRQRIAARQAALAEEARREDEARRLAQVRALLGAAAEPGVGPRADAPVDVEAPARQAPPAVGHADLPVDVEAPARQAPPAVGHADLPVDLRPGLLAYKELPVTLRAALRGAGLPPRARELLGWLDEILGTHPDAPARTAAEAVLALEAARQRLPADPQGALDLIAAHARHLDPLRAAQALQREARALLREAAQREARRRAEEALAAAEAEADPRQALERVAALDPQHLPAELGERLQRLRQQHAGSAFLQDVTGRVQAALLRHDVNAVRAGMAQLERCRGPNNGKELDHLLETVEDGLRRSFRAQIVSGEGPEHELCDVSLSHRASHDGPQQWLLPGGRELLVVERLSSFLFLRVVGCESGRVRRRASLTWNDAFGKLHTVQVEPEGAWLHLDTGEALLVDPADFRLLRRYERRRPRSFADGTRRVPITERARVIGGRFLWQDWHNESGSASLSASGCRVFVRDLWHPQDLREVAAGRVHRAAPGVDQPVLCTDHQLGGRLGLHAARGAPLGEVRLPAGLRLLSCAEHPAGGALLLCSSHERNKEKGSEEAQLAGLLHLVHLRPDGTMGEPLRIADAEDACYMGLVSLPALGEVLLRLRQPYLPHLRPHRVQLVRLRTEAIVEPAAKSATDPATDPTAEPTAETAAETAAETTADPAADPAAETTTDPAADPAPPRPGAPAGDLRIVDRCDLPDKVVLVHDAARTRCLALCATETGLEAQALGDGPPRFRGPLAELDRIEFEPMGVYLCGFSLDNDWMLQSTLCDIALVGEDDAAGRLEAALRFARKPGARPCAAAGVVQYLGHRDGDAAADAAADALAADGPVRQLWVAHGLAFGRRWARCLALCAALDPAALPDDDLRRHLHHMRALSLLWTGEPERAMDEVRACRAYGTFRCLVASLEELGPVPSQASCEEDIGYGRAELRALRALCTEADELLAAGRARDAWALLDQGVVWRARELQTLARMCAAQLEIEWTEEIDRFRQLHALALYRHVARTGALLRIEVPFPGRIWPRERLAELSRRARRWMLAHLELEKDAELDCGPAGLERGVIEDERPGS